MDMNNDRIIVKNDILWFYLKELNLFSFWGIMVFIVIFVN